MVKMNKKDLALFCYPWDVIDEGYDAIIDAASGNAFGGVAGGTTVALPSGQKIAH